MEQIKGILSRVFVGIDRWADLRALGFDWDGAGCWVRGEDALNETVMFRMSEDAWRAWLTRHQ